ncbi:MAG TPA: tryptophan synthase subunit alpha [Gemmatimonadaceae bacterium]|nr:tryptophan synthase subunit alpha [Gemmatimonadaceae bacterium]
MSATTSSDVVAARLADLKRRERRALVVYVTAGHPTPNDSLALMRKIARAGADIIEVGIPFSDPMADGPVIQASSQIALAQGMTVGRTLELIRAADLDIPVVLFSYLNPLLAAGTRVLEHAAAAGAHGVLVTDLPVGADPERERWLGEGPLAFVRLVAPTTPTDRMRDIGAHGSGFVYLISRTGVTGERAELSAELPRTVERLRSATALPICVGFGISTPQQARAVGALADGVVVGSAVVREAAKSTDRAAELVQSLRRALD